MRTLIALAARQRNTLRSLHSRLPTSYGGPNSGGSLELSRVTAIATASLSAVQSGGLDSVSPPRLSCQFGHYGCLSSSRPSQRLLPTAVATFPPNLADRDLRGRSLTCRARSDLLGGLESVDPLRRQLKTRDASMVPRSLQWRDGISTLMSGCNVADRSQCRLRSCSVGPVQQIPYFGSRDRRNPPMADSCLGALFACTPPRRSRSPTAPNPSWQHPGPYDTAIFQVSRTARVGSLISPASLKFAAQRWSTDFQCWMTESSDASVGDSGQPCKHVRQ